MYNTIRYSLMFLTCLVLASTVNADAFDQTVNQIKAVEAKLEQNRTELQEQQAGIEQTLDTEFANHALSGPKSEFESDADYAKRLVHLDAAMAQRRTELKEARLSPTLSRRRDLLAEIGRLQQTVFPTNNVTVTLGTYNANEEFFPIDFEVDGYDPVSRTLSINKSDAFNLKNNWNRVTKTAHIVIDPGYRRALAQVKLEYPPLWENGFTFTFDVVYDLGENNRAVAFSPDGKYIATGGERGNGSIWQVSNGNELRQMELNGSVYAVAFSPDGEYLAAGDSSYVGLFRVKNGEEVWKRYRSNGAMFFTSYLAVYSVAFSPDGEYLGVGDERYVGLFRVKNGEEVWKRYRSNGAMFFTSYAAVHSVAFSPDGEYLATGDTFDDAIIRDTSTGSEIRKMEHADNVWAVAFSSDGEYLVTGDDAGYLSIHEVSSGIKVKEIKEEEGEGWIGAVAFSPDGTYFATGDASGSITFYQMPQGEITIESQIAKVKTLKTSASVFELAWHPNGSLISDGNKVYRTLLEPIIAGLAAKSPDTTRDVNSDGVIDIDDLVLVASNFGKSFAANATPNPDVNRDGIVNRQDVLEIIKILERNTSNAGKGAPAVHSHRQLVTTLQRWIDEAKQRSGEDQVYQRGIAVLEQILATLTLESVVPTETRLLSNYPNPFNPETWIPYQLSEPAEVSLRIYALNGTLVRTVDFGHQPAGVYQTKSRAAYWDGRNELGERVASGLYFYTFTAGEFTATRKMLIRK